MTEPPVVEQVPGQMTIDEVLDERSTDDDSSAPPVSCEAGGAA